MVVGGDVFPVAGFVAAESLVRRKPLVAYATLVGYRLMKRWQWRGLCGGNGGCGGGGGGSVSSTTGKQHETES